MAGSTPPEVGYPGGCSATVPERGTCMQLLDVLNVKAFEVTVVEKNIILNFEFTQKILLKII